MRLSVVIVAASLGQGGAERVSASLANKLVAFYTRVSLFCLSSTQASYEVEPRVNLVIGGPRQRYGLVRFFFWSIFNRPNVILFSVRDISLKCAWVAILLRIPFVCQEAKPYRDDWFGASSFFRNSVLRYIYSSSRLVIANSLGTQKSLIEFCPACRINSIVVRNPIVLPTRTDKNSIRPNEGMVRLVAIGRLHPEKDYQFLLRVISLLKNQGRNVLLEIFGDGPCYYELSQAIHRLGLTGHVKMMGFVKDPFEVTTGKIFVLTSLLEGFGNVLVEAMYADLRIVAMDCPGGVSEVLKDGEMGYLVKNRNEEEFASAIMRAHVFEKFPGDGIRVSAAKYYQDSTVAIEYKRALERIFD